MPRRDPGQDTTTMGDTTKPRSHAIELARSVVLTILYHRDPARIGERAPVDTQVLVSRNVPSFAHPGSEDARSIDDSHVSREPFRIALTDDRGVEIAPGPGKTRIRVAGAELGSARRFDAKELERGISLDLNSAVVLLLHSITPAAAQTDAPSAGSSLLGASAAIDKIRTQIARVARHDVPVLIRGESGTGKELVARAIHDASARAGRPFVSVNLAAIPAATAAAALFGHVRGAFTGAVQASSGYFGAADTGTLFLDEVGEAPEEVQVSLLRALESGEVQPVGSPATRKVDLRLVAATDADLEARANDGRFRLPLIMRLSGYELALPRLAERPDDIARLFVHFVREELAATGRLERLSPADDHGQAWLPSWLVEGLLAHAWPGNVRELKNFVRQLVIDQVDVPRIQRSALEWLGRHSARKVAGDARAEQPPAAAEADAPEPVARTSRRTLEDIREDEVADVMRKHRFEPGPAAQELGISRTSLYVLLERHPHLKKAKDLSADDIRRALDAHGRRLPAAAEQLGVSVRALRLRMSDLGLD